MPKGLKLWVVVEDSASLSNSLVWAQHGLCLFLEIALGAKGTMNLLLDAGNSAKVTLHNLDALRLNPRSLDFIVLSHGHYDHTGGLLGVLKRAGKRTPILAHPEIFRPKLKITPFLKFIGPPFTSQEAEAVRAVMLYSRSSTALTNGVMTTGEIQRDANFEKVEGFRTVMEDELMEDVMVDDQALVVNIQNKGLVVITGCAHSGIINTILQAQKLSGVQDIYAIVGGFHLHGASEKRLDSTVDELLKLNPQVLLPGHCTGTNAVCRLLQAFEDRCKPLAAGDVIDL
jgi:7,8-dihydropterin-6-yl-methyl-4-(beta-D-ribofuranosyl)aminobenzene 5'-phosphate synthase